MKTSKLLSTAIICILSQGFSSSTYAAGPWYIGTGAGTTKTNAGAADIHPNLQTDYAPSSTSVDDKDNGWKVFIGRQITSNIAGELSYTKLGTFTLDANTTIPSVGTLHDTVKPDAYCLSAVGRSNPINNFRLLGRAGVCRWNDHYSTSFSGGTVSPASAGSTGTGLLLGLGVGYKLTTAFTIRAEWERYYNVIHDNKDADLLSASILYHF